MINNTSEHKSNLLLSIAGEVESYTQALDVYNSSYGENGSSNAIIHISENASILSETNTAININNVATQKANMELVIEGTIEANHHAFNLMNYGIMDEAQTNIVLTESSNVIANDGAGIMVSNQGMNSSNVNMSVAGNISSQADSIYISNLIASPDNSSKVILNIADSSMISSEQSTAIVIRNDKDIDIIANGSITGTAGIFVIGMDSESQAKANIHVGGTIEGTDGTAIDLSNYMGESATLSLVAGWNIKGQTLASNSENNYLVLTGNETSSLDLNLIGNEQDQNGILGFNHFVKEGSSIWHLTNSLERNNGFDSAKITSGGVILDNASFAMNDSANNPFTIESAATLYNSGNSSIIGDIYNSGVISFSNPLMDKRFISDQSGTLTIDGNYHGNEGYLVINTELADDTAQTDKLVITGDTTGNTQVVVNNRGGIGGQTQEGIEIIEVYGENSASDESAIVAGAYAYTLQQHDLTTGSNGNWYLRSTQLGANTPMHEIYPRVLLALNGLPTLKQRTGGSYLQDTPVSQYTSYLDAYQAEQADTQDLWVRIDREYIKFNPEQSATESAYNINTFNLQMGYDGFKRQTDNGTLIAGVNVNIGRAQANTTSYFGDGRIHSNAYGFGFNGTWYNKDGYYIDGQTKFNWLRSDLTSKETHTTLAKNNNGFGYAFGLESGKRINLDDRWTLVPQAQLVWSSVNFNQFKDIYDAEVSINKGDSLQARLGLAIENQTSWQDQNGELSHRNLYGIVNFYTELMNETKITVDDVSLINKSDRNWAELGLGMNYGWNNNRYNAFIELSSRSSLKDFADTYAVKGTAGFKIHF